MTIDIFRTGLAKGIHFAESNPELETNSRIQNEWKIISSRQHKRHGSTRRASREPQWPSPEEDMKPAGAPFQVRMSFFL